MHMYIGAGLGYWLARGRYIRVPNKHAGTRFVNVWPGGQRGRKKVASMGLGMREGVCVRICRYFGTKTTSKTPWYILPFVHPIAPPPPISDRTIVWNEIA